MWKSFFVLPAAHASVALPDFPETYTAVFTLELPYAGLTIPLRVANNAADGTQEVDYYRGLQQEFTTSDGSYKYVYQNGERACMHNEAPHSLTEGGPVSIIPDASEIGLYQYKGEEVVDGTLCQKWVLDVAHGSTGSMDDHIVFYWDALMKKPVEWHMHSRNRIFGSHTDEYIVKYIDFSEGAPSLTLPDACTSSAVQKKPNMVQQIRSFLGRHHTSFSSTGADKFAMFAMQHGKKYANAEERAKREAIFHKNLKKIDELNKKHAGMATFKGNKFLDMEVDEVMKFRGGLAKKAKKNLRGEKRTIFQKQENVDLPKNFDWRTEMPGALAPVKDQGICGSCWAFSFISAMESAWYLQTKKMTLLPEQFVLDCGWTDTSAACDGGLSNDAGRNIIKAFGGVIPSAASYGSYLTVDGYCRGIEGKTVGAKIADWVDITARDQDAVMQALVKQPLSVAFNVQEEAIFYDSGILVADDCKNNSSDELNHAINLVGYGTDETSGQDYWILRNSWSTYWGDEGYFRVARGELDCGVSTDAGFPVVEVSTPADENVEILS